MQEIVTPDEMGRIDRLAIERGPFDGPTLMRNAGRAVGEVVLRHFPGAARIAVLCGPGNNGGDGYVAARILAESGAAVIVYREGEPKAGSGNGDFAALWMGDTRNLSEFAAESETLVVDALYGAGLSRAVPDSVARVIADCAEAGCSVVAVDLPSGVDGASGRILGHAFQATLTVTFVRRKPGHLLLPGKQLCGQTLVVDIGIAAAVVAKIGPLCFENRPQLWHAAFPTPSIDAYKYSRGHLAVFSGGHSATGAARLSAMAGARIGAGAVTLLSPSEAIAANAAHLTSIMLKASDGLEDALAFIAARKPAALVYGPGLGPAEKTGEFLLELLSKMSPPPKGVVIDADGLTSLGKQRDAFVAAVANRVASALVLTPHEGEFSRLFPDLAAADNLSKLDRARRAAERAKAVVVYKGPDTVIASPDGRAAINCNGTPWLATAGSGDVLAGMIGGLLAQDMPAFEAACAAVWMHAEAARRFGSGLIAEDLPEALLPVLRELHETPSAS